MAKIYQNHRANKHINGHLLNNNVIKNSNHVIRLSQMYMCVAPCAVLYTNTDAHKYVDNKIFRSHKLNSAHRYIRSSSRKKKNPNYIKTFLVFNHKNFFLRSPQKYLYLHNICDYISVVVRM